MSRVLVVEDDKYEQALLKCTLEKNGYVADVAADGLTALHMLRTGDYALALLDYHLPEVDGFASAKLARELIELPKVPKLIATTGYAAELEAREGVAGVFDAIVAKPYKLPQIVELIKNELRDNAMPAQLEAADATWGEHGLIRAPAARVVPKPTHAQERFLQTLFDLSGQREPEVVLLADENCWREAVDLRAGSDLSLCPFIDLTDDFGHTADISFSGLDPNKLGAIARKINQFADRRKRLAPSFQHASTTEDRLLAYLFLSGKSLHPARAAETKSGMRYSGFYSAAEVTIVAEKLARRGLLKKEFSDRYHNCPQCESARLNVREECPSCRSSHLCEESIIHHFRCAHQTAENEFQSGSELVCPKCLQHLRHYGSDYDKPGHIFICADCDHACSEVSVGFVCFDCGTHTDGEAMPRRDIYSYHLTDAAIQLVTAPINVVQLQTEKSGELPEKLNDQIFKIANGDSAQGEPVAVSEICYRASGEIIANRGRTAFAKLRKKFLNNLAAALPGATEIHKDGDRDFILMDCDPEEVDEDLIKYCQKAFAEELEPQIRKLDPPIEAQSA